MGQKVEKSSLEPKKSLLICCRGHWYGSIEPSLSQDSQGSVFFNIALKSGAKSSVANMGHKGGFSRRCPTSYVWARYSFGTFLWSLWIIPTKIARCEGLSKNGLFVPSPSCGILTSQRLSYRLWVFPPKIDWIVQNLHSCNRGAQVGKFTIGSNNFGYCCSYLVRLASIRCLYCMTWRTEISILSESRG